jgi:hypothetical protein
MTNHQTTTEHVPVARSVAVCSCGWRAHPQLFIEWAEADGRDHVARPEAPAKPPEDPISKRLRAVLDDTA